MTFIGPNFHHCHTVQKNLSTQLLWQLQKRFKCGKKKKKKEREKILEQGVDIMEAGNERFCDKISLFSKVILVLKLGYSIYLACHRPISSLTTVFKLCAVQVRSLCILQQLLLLSVTKEVN
jgi:hypothetical protein